MPDILTGLFLNRRTQNLHLYHLKNNTIQESLAPLSSLPEIEASEKTPIWVLRHSLGVADGGPEDYSQTRFEAYAAEDRESQLSRARTESGRLRDLQFRGFVSAPIPHGYVHAVGPIHAGIIEPGHFRFSLQGEHIRALRIRLGFQRRGILNQLEGAGPRRAQFLAETISGDTTVGYSFAFSAIFEKAWKIDVSPETAWWKRLLLEIERMAIHIGDLGAIAGDIGYYPLQGIGSADRGVPLGVMETLTGSRFAKAAMWPGHVRTRRGLSREDLLRCADRIEQVAARVSKAFHIACAIPSISERLQGCGQLTHADVRHQGLVGMAARCTGLPVDLRLQDPVYRSLPCQLDLQLPLVELEGDAWARFWLRALEIERSAAWVAASLREISIPQASFDPAVLEKSKPAAPGVHWAAVEAWRGPVLVACDIGDDGLIRQAYVRDPSVLNWRGLELAVRGELVGDFPLNNKSFNLSYVGVDL